MKVFIKFGIVFLLTATAFIHTAHAQYMEFTENKGQWDKEVKYVTDMKGGALFLKATGYKVQLDNPDDSRRIAQYFSGHKMPADTAVHANGKNHDAIKTVVALDDTSSTPASLILHSHAYEVSFLNADASAEAIPEKAMGGVSNYFIGNDKSKWAAGCRSFNTITYRNIYKNIDLRYYSDNGNLKYDLIVKPGADVSKLALKYDGLDNISVNKYGNIVLKTSVGEVYEQKPYSYQAGAAGRVKIDAKYVVEGNVVKFKLGNYDKTQTLIIDPSLKFSTFIGSTADNWGYTATYDGSGNFYAGGIVFGNGYRYKQTNGAFQTTFQGGSSSEGTSGYDIGISKFNPDGTQRLYATYIGGSGDEQPHSLVVDSKGDLIISGRTSSSSSFPVTTSTYGAGGGFDIFLARLNPDGTQLLGSRLFGGEGSDGVNINPKTIGGSTTSIRRNYGDDARSEVIVDSSDDIYLASCTQSKDFPVTNNASQKALNGYQDGVFIKASPDLQTVYNSTFIGGNGDDAAFVLAINPKDRNVFIGGSTTSNSGLAQNATNSGVIRSSFGGGTTDGFITIFGNAGNGPLIKTVYIGGSGVDMLYGLQFDKFGFPYIMGTTTVSFPVTSNVAWSQPTGKQFITKLKPDLTSVEYSTNFGPNTSVPNISPVAFLVDVCENVYVSGWGGIGQESYQRNTTLGLPVTPNGAVLSDKTDGSDFYFFVLEKNAASQLFGAFYGIIDPAAFGDHVDGGTSRFDKRGVIYQAICADCLKAGDPTSFTTAGVYSPSNPALNGAYCNEAAVKVAFEFSGVISSIRASVNGVIKNTGCVPLKIDFTDTLGLGKTYIWDFGDGSKRDTTSSATDSHTYDNIGRYSVMLISVDSSTCNISDTAYTTVVVKDNEAKLAVTYEKLPPCQSLNFQFTNNSIAPAGFPFDSNSFTWDFGDGTAPVITNDKVVTHQFAASGTYNVVLRLTDTTYCNAPDSLLIVLRVSDILKAQFVTPLTGCAPYNAVINNTSLGGENFAWDFGDGTTSTTNEQSFTHLYENPGTYTISLSATDRFTCNPTDDTSLTITVFPAPVASFNYGPTVPKENTPVNFFNTSTGGIRYHWDFGDGDTLVTTSLSTPVSHQYNSSGIFKACLVAYNENECSDDTCVEVSALVSPLVDVPNAFSPNNDGINDIVSVKGYGITKMSWRIYNRWGQLVHQASSLKDFWDGKVNGVLQAQDVYTYVLDVTFSDNKTYRKTGDITLLR